MDTKARNILLEQYKLYVNLMDNVSARRLQTNRFYLSLLTLLLAIPSMLSMPLFGVNELAALLTSLLGLALCFVWIINIHSYRQLNSGKFKVIHEMEKELPFACFDMEWDFLERGQNTAQYKPLSLVEKYVPYGLLVPYLALITHLIYTHQTAG